MSYETKLLNQVIQASLPAGTAQFEAFSSLLSGSQYLNAYRELNSLGLPPGSAVLDWGCGDGHFSYALLQSRLSVTSFIFHGECPLSPMLRESGGDLVRADQNEPVKLPFPDGYFRAVFSVGVLEHVRENAGDEAASLREIHRILGPDGLFFCCHFPNKGSLVEFLIRNFFPKRYHHKFLYRRSDIESLVASSGFRLERIHRYGILPKNMFKSSLGTLSNKSWFVSLYYAVDRVLEKILPFLAQNWFFLARKA